MRILQDTIQVTLPKLQNDPFDFSLPVNVVGLITNICAIIYALVPIGLLIKIHKKILKPNDTPYFVMMTLLIMGLFWISYGILKPDNKFFIIMINIFNYGFNLIYMSIYFYYRFERSFIKAILYSIPLYLGSAGLFAIFTYAIAIMNVSRYIAMTINIGVKMGPAQNIVNFKF